MPHRSHDALSISLGFVPDGRLSREEPLALELPHCPGFALDCCLLGWRKGAMTLCRAAWKAGRFERLKQGFPHFPPCAASRFLTHSLTRSRTIVLFASLLVLLLWPHRAKLDLVTGQHFPLQCGPGCLWHLGRMQILMFRGLSRYDDLAT